MASIFLETSALAKRYIQEEGTSRVLDLIEETSDPMVSALAFVEVTSAAVRRARAGDLREDHLGSLLDTLGSEFRERFRVVELSAGLVARAADLVRAHALRAGDAIQLACALTGAVGVASAEEILFVSSDVELNAAAENEGLTVLDPQRAA